MAATIVELNTEEEIQKLVSTKSETAVVVLGAWASWEENSQETVRAALQAVTSTISSKGESNDKLSAHLVLGLIDAGGDLAELVEKLKITNIPSIVLVNGVKALLDSIKGAEAKQDAINVVELQEGKVEVQEKVANAALSLYRASVSAGASQTAAKSKQATGESDDLSYLDPKLVRLVNYQPVMVIIKGTPDLPRCKFSRELINILNDLKIQYATFNILADEKIRQRMKEWAQWPTYPQIYVNGELIGGLDILKDMIKSGEFMKMLPDSALVQDAEEEEEEEEQEGPATKTAKRDIDAHLKELINRAPIMLFMKGTPSSPNCGFSNKLVGLLNDKNVKFDSFDIFTDEEVRQGLKVYSDWPTYPQLYIKGELVGGLDIVKDMIESGEFDNLVKGI